ncbi:FAD-dependent monooxygenase [Amycolatopsis viridis]|uniref:2-polyprenyl-6-methoxyphenol hydroxylase-like FAD-dependent oxidoreductase n=1 Tax=Amycolatopsis viridis TaxID=185678 RepID=A0ABX0SYY4_9PSEU|nr:FAD-dependent monooxygenase [Amycolatopsis viridis]NIH82193.1 2-polyprenyl-6-methoxyphenol hydroxylase-like FAD-dependent oxidoreductase [Amycolatopsis viridis]
MNAQILIAGAGIGGLTTAYWLARHGFRPTVVERAPGPRPGGNGVDVREQAIDVVDRMGILTRIRAAAADVRSMKFVDARNRAVARLDVAGATEPEIMRGDLVALLRDVTEGVEYVFGDGVRDLTQDADGVTVAFEHGPDRRFDLVIGADGLHSTVRRLAFGPEADHVTHGGHYFAFANADASLGEDRCVTMFNRPGHMAGLYRSGNHLQAKAYFIFRSAPIAYDHRDVAAHKRLVHAAFAHETGWRVQELLAAALGDPDFYFDAVSQVRMDSWSAGRVTLVGDAAWCASPASGAGAELALVGAYRLAGELVAASGDHRIAFPRYQDSHRALVLKRQQIGPNVRLMVPGTRTGIAVRNAVARLPLLRAAAAVERRYRTQAPTLPEYTPGV